MFIFSSDLIETKGKAVFIAHTAFYRNIPDHTRGIGGLMSCG